jgi:hypothetical protein
VRILFVTICAVTMAALIGYSGPTRAASATLTGKMAAFNYLIGGSWSCSTKIPATVGRPAHTSQATVTYAVAPSNVFHNHVSAANYSRDRYSGYSAKSNLYWSASADNMGSYSHATSIDGHTYTGITASSVLSTSIKVETTFTKVKSNKVTVHEAFSGGGLQEAAETVCTR